jgi:hypothetical protein
MATRRVLVLTLFLVTSSAFEAPLPRAARADTTASSPQPAASDDPAAADAPPSSDETVGVEPEAYADTDPSALEDFQAALDPHGTWVDDPQYGLVWTPNVEEVGADFRPYVSAGHWAYGTEYVWVSDYDWGWAPFHYGRWVWSGANGWAWIPGRAYAGAWVIWRIEEDGFAYVGWAPMPPVWVWRGGVPIGIGATAWPPFTYCATREMFGPALTTRVVAGEPAATIANHTRPYVRATPALAGRPLALPAVHGPAPSLLGLDASLVTRLTGREQGLARAWQYARPSTAQAIGARAPVPRVVRSMPVPARYSLPPRPVQRAPRRR